MIIVDSTVWIDFFNQVTNPETKWLAQQIPLKEIGLNGLILCEVLQGFRDDSEFEMVHQKLASFDIFDSGTEDAAVASARNYRLLRQRGITIRKTIDCLIASFCIANEHSLLHRDRDFDAFETHLGLHVIHP